MKTTQRKLPFPKDETTSPEVMEAHKYIEHEFQVSEIETTYNLNNLLIRSALFNTLNMRGSN
jgi:hypothetical protein